MSYSYRPQARLPAGREAIEGYVLPGEGERRLVRRVRWRRALLALVILGLALMAMFIYKSPLLRVQSVQVVGAANVDPQAVREAADLNGTSMLHPPLDEAERRIAIAFPLVKAVEIERRWPQTTRIEIVERVPWGSWQVGEKTYVVDDEGIVLEGVAPAAEAPTVFDKTSDRELIVGDRVDADSIGLTVRLAQDLGNLLGLGVSRFEYDQATGLTAFTSADYQVIFGDAQNYDYKLAVWQALEGQLGREAMAGRILDLRFGDRPSLR